MEQMEQSTHIVKDPADAAILATKRDQFHLIQFLMALTSEFEPVRATLLQQVPLPTLEFAMSQLLSHETRLRTLQPHHPDAVLATARSLFQTHHPDAVLATAARPSSSSSSRNGPKYCKNCHKQGHLLAECPTIQCRYCHKIGHIVYNCPTKPPKPGQSGILPRPVNHSVAAAAEDSSSDPSLSSIPVSELGPMVFTMVKQFLSSSDKVSSAVSGNTWYFDSACCNHMSPDSQLFSSIIPTTHTPLIQTANGSHLAASHTGSVSTSTLSLSDTYLIPNLTLNLISVGQLCELGFDLWFGSSGCRVQDPWTNQVLGTGRRVGRMFELTSLHLPTTSTPPPSHVAHTASVFPLSLWHLRLVTLFLMPSFDLIHSDIWGPSPTATVGGSKYFVIFVDDFSRYTWIYLMHNRSELAQIYRTFAQMISTQFSKTIKIFRTDNAMEYRDSQFLDFIHTQGTLIQRSCAGTSQQNGRAERKHRHILDSVRAFLISASCPERFWGEAALTAVYTINRLPSSALQNVTPFERLYGTPASYSSLRAFGCACFVLLQSHEHSKLEPRSRLCCFLGYGIEHKGYRCWDPISQRLRISRHVVFWEHIMFNSLSKFTTCSTPSFFTNPSLPLFPISPADSPTSPLAPPLAVDPVLDQTPDLPLAAPPVDSPALP
uniref:Integrase catalytic domain-containing protein n=1 Tax=Fagus sylvatica TaxID=28930 RepID=A0A2N9EVF0_FAGSY